MEKRIHDKTEQALAQLEEIANNLNNINDPQAKRLALALHILTSATWIEHDKEVLDLLNPLTTKLLKAAKENGVF